jgi:hypothetical protein
VTSSSHGALIKLSIVIPCYKVFQSEVIKSITIDQNGFGIEPELTAKIAKKHCRIYEVDISYYGRSYGEGKKITRKDGIKALYVIVRYFLFS